MEKDKKMKRVIVTGATGFVGANLTRRLVEDSHEIHLLVRRGCNSWRIKDIYSKVSLHETDLTDGDALAGVVSEIKPEWIENAKNIDIVSMALSGALDELVNDESCRFLKKVILEGRSGSNKKYPKIAIDMPRTSISEEDAKALVLFMQGDLQK